MPLYEYKCSECNLVFEELVKSAEGSESMPCVKCGKNAVRQISAVASSVKNGSPNETVDVTIGRAAERRWQDYYDRQSKRRGSKNLERFPQPQSNDGKYMPVMALGGKDEKKKRGEFVEALQEHRRKRVEKGIPQFSGPGEF